MAIYLFVGTFNFLYPVSSNELNKKLRLLKKELKGNTKGHKEYYEIKEQRDNISLQVLDRLKLKVKPHLDYLDGGYHMIVGKSRRKGYSYKNGAICANVYNTNNIIHLQHKSFK